MVELRPYRPGDLDALYDICLLTGDSGKDATGLYADPRLIGHIYSAPYGVLAPELAFVAEDEQGVVGYVVGVADTRAFDERLERDWWPTLRQRIEDPSVPPEGRTSDQRLGYLIHHPGTTPHEVVSRFPAHMHMNVLPRAQGRKVGSRLFDMWVAAALPMGVRGLHVGVSPTNAGGRAFWESRGFVRVPPHDGVWLGQDISAR